MSILDLAALLVSLAAVFAWVNHRVFKLPAAIGLMLIALLMSLGIIAAGHLGLEGFSRQAERIVAGIDFNETLMQGMLSFLLFAGALHTNLQNLLQQRWVILVLASLGVVISTFLIGALAYLVLGMLGLALPFVYCLLFGALISPTDPIAVLGILKRAGAPKTLETKIVGESLFNDGVGVVVFIAILGAATTGHADPGHVALLLLEEAGGGALFGLLVGYITFLMLRSVDSYTVEILLTLGLVMGGYAIASAIHVSGPIAMVVAGLLIGNHGRVMAMSETTRLHLDQFWELLDEALNAVLFVLMGLEIIILTYTGSLLLAGLLMIPAVLLARFIAVGTPISLMRFRREFTPGAVKIMTWGGLRGGISIALALSIPAGPERSTILAITYTVVVFSIIVQGMTVGALVGRLTGNSGETR